MLLTITRVFSQWLDEVEAEDEGVDEEGDEAEVAPGDDHWAIESLDTTSLFCTGFFLFSEETFCEFPCVFLHFSLYFVH